MEQGDMRENMLVGRNPIREAIKAGRQMEKLLVQQGELSGSARQIVAWAREAHIVVQYVDKVRLDQLYSNHQGMIAFVSAARYHTVEDILAYAKEQGEEPFVIVLDGITDPHNLGAIIRTAECAGAHGVIIPERRSAGLNPAAVKASAGACEYQRIAKVVNLSRTLDELKKQGLWVIGADMQGDPIAQADLSGAIALVIGSEGEGIAHLVQKQCDKLVSLPLKGHIDSLNASVAAGVMMYEVMRKRGH
ncbi:23S rRNA (guanosine(2251)-2'-O)-methyltransferase RlmB [Eubacteriales bacterium OttesenSCG-928-N13]|nr:23S rRNA (guanosine(2251)-2'-O)-methyltransferase RlmB [Eubacteriales bacterium OttesenSCG-928-N13]